MELIERYKYRTMIPPLRLTLTKLVSGLKGPRFMKFVSLDNDRNGCGHLLVAERDAGNILLVDLDPRQDNPVTVVQSGLSSPTSLDLDLDGDTVYVGEIDKISRFNLRRNRGTQSVPLNPLDKTFYNNNNSRHIFIDNLPDTGRHTTKTVLIDQRRRKLFISVGSSCNTCIESDNRRATILDANLPSWTGSDETSFRQREQAIPKIYAYGLRNSVGLAFNPWTRDLWASTNGSDHLGDDIPDDTIDVIFEGSNYGWPECHAGKYVDQTYGHSNSCMGIPQPIIRIQAHSAPLGLAFLDPRDSMAPPNFPRGLYVALHGSWNRSESVGHSIIFIPLDEFGQPSGEIQTIFQGDANFRPSGLAFGPCGLYISDDDNGTLTELKVGGHGLSP